MPAERIGESLAFINWTVLTALGVGSFAAVVAGRFRTDATRGYLGFTAFSAAAFALLAAFADSGLPALSRDLGVRADPGWEGPRRLAMLALPLLAAAYGIAVWRGHRAVPIALAGLAAAALVLVGRRAVVGRRRCSAACSCSSSSPDCPPPSAACGPR